MRSSFRVVHSDTTSRSTAQTGVSQRAPLLVRLDVFAPVDWQGTPHYPARKGPVARNQVLVGHELY